MQEQRQRLVGVSETDAYAITRYAREATHRYMKLGDLELLDEAQKMVERYGAIARELNRQNNERSVTS